MAGEIPYADRLRMESAHVFLTFARTKFTEESAGDPKMSDVWGGSGGLNLDGLAIQGLRRLAALSRRRHE